jgi:hypothetical protein
MTTSAQEVVAVRQCFDLSTNEPLDMTARHAAGSAAPVPRVDAMTIVRLPSDTVSARARRRRPAARFR